ncbi:MAG: hypothetical protein Q8930_09500 [Bacillota bacterium]|nr:hypothetical protein [Bacillota bacterium]
MYREFIKKMVKAQILQYEAVKEILPEAVKRRVDNFEKGVVNLLKDVALEVVRENNMGIEQPEKRESKKVNVDFS